MCTIQVVCDYTCVVVFTVYGDTEQVDDGIPGGFPSVGSMFRCHRRNCTQITQYVHTHTHTHTHARRIIRREPLTWRGGARGSGEGSYGL